MSLSLATNNCIRLANNKQRQTISDQQVISRQITGKQKPKANNKANNKQTTYKQQSEQQAHIKQTTFRQQSKQQANNSHNTGKQQA